MYKLLITTIFFVTWFAVAITNPSSSVELVAQSPCTLDPFVLNSSGVLMCSELVVPLFSGVHSEAGEDLVIFYRSYQNVTCVCVE